MISDLHFGKGVSVAKAKSQLEALCGKIRTEFTPKETILFIIMGDIINASDTTAFADARVCLNCIREELHDFAVKFEFIPGNHDLPSGNIEPFDKFIAEYGASCPFGGTAAYSKVYDDVNFIFADSTLSRDHRLPGRIDIEAIRGEVKNKLNILFCHHGFTHSFGGDHDVIENGDVILNKLWDMGIHFVVHGHTHRADATIPPNGIVEIGCGTLFKDLSDMDGIPNQFSVGYIDSGKLDRVERFVVSKDGGNVFPHEIVYPEQRTFADPQSIGKQTYNAISDYIQRKVLPHSVIGEDFGWLFSKSKELSLQNALIISERVLFLSDAGQGKSIEMENLAHELGKTMYFPYLFKLRNYTGSTIDALLPSKYSDVPPHYRALLFDGYDELPVEYRRLFENHLNLYVENNTGVHIVISSRSNFCKAEKDNESRTFPGFQIYDLCELSTQNIETYLKIHGVEPKHFLSDARTAGIYNLMNNAFYLTKVCALYRKLGALPKKVELMDKLIETCFDTDDKKFAKGLEDNYFEFVGLLKRVAFAMQLMQQSKFDDRSEYQVLFSKSERDLVIHSGLIVKEGDTWRFIHNNFREYLTAKYLSEMNQEQVVSYISSGTGIYPSWVNTLGYLTGIEVSWDLIGWIAANAPNALVKFEPDRVDSATRNAVFTRLFNYYEDRRLWFRDDICDAEELANFSESDTTLTFLLNKISTPVHNISQYTAVDILRHFRMLYGRQDEVLDCLLNCCRKFPETRKDVCRLAIYAINELELSNPEVTSQLIALFSNTDSDYVRLGMYEYLVETKSQNEYVKFFLDGIYYVLHEKKRDNNRVSNELYALVDGLKAMSTADSVSTVLEWFSSAKSVDFHDAEEVFTVLSHKAIQLYSTGIKSLYAIMLKCCIKSMREYDHKKTQACIDFFVDTETLDTAAPAAAQHLANDICYISDMLYQRPETFRYLYTAYAKGQFNDHGAFRYIAIHYADEDEIYAECSKLIEEYTGIPLPERESKTDYASERQKGEYEYFDALFSKEKAENMLAELLTVIDKPDILVKDLLNATSGLHWYSPFKSLTIAIYHGANKASRVADFFTSLEFDRFTIIECKNILNRKTGIVISKKQKEHIRDIIIRYLEQDVLKSEVGYKNGDACVSTFVDSLVFLAQYFNFSVDEEKLLDMTLVPCLCFGESKANRKYEYLKEHTPRIKLKGRIAQDLRIIDLDNMLLRDHLTFCSDMMYDVATGKALALCNTASVDCLVRSTALDYLYKLYGADYICNRVLPNATGSFLLEIAEKCIDSQSQLLLCALENEFSKAPSYELMAYLISLGSATGIEAYVEEVSAALHIPEMDVHPESPTRVIGRIGNPEFLPLLGKLIDVVCNPQFVDDSFYGLRGSLANAIINCGRNAPAETIALVEEHRMDTDNSIRFCNYVIEEVKRNQQKNLDHPRSLQEVQHLLKMT